MKRLFFAITALVFSLGLMAQVAWIDGPSTITAYHAEEYELSFFSGFSDMWVGNADCGAWTSQGGITDLTVETTEGGHFTVYGYTNGSPALPKTVTVLPIAPGIYGPPTAEGGDVVRWDVYEGADDYNWEISTVSGSVSYSIVGGGDGSSYLRIYISGGGGILHIFCSIKQNGVWGGSVGYVYLQVT